MKESDKPTINETSIESVEHLDYITEPNPPIVIKSSVESIGYTPKLDKPIVSKSSIESIGNVPESNEPTISNKIISNTIGSEARKAKTQVNRKRRLERHELGRMDQVCTHCNTKFWISEKDHNSNRGSPIFVICCAHGKVYLQPLSKPPSYLLDLYTLTGPDADSFRKNIRGYNNILAYMSFEANINEFQGREVSNFQIHGQVYHCIGSLLPADHTPVFAQLYVYDIAHEGENWRNIMRELNEDIIKNLQDMLDECNPYIQNFRQIRDLIQENVTTEISMLIYSDRTQDPDRYGPPTASEVAIIMVDNDHEMEPSSQDILLRLRIGGLQRISEFYSSYDPLHYILLFPRGNDGWYFDIPLIGAKKRNKVTAMQYYFY
ncbi:9051_t:CDS:1, partial [Acaulospora morrowiae]